MKPRTLFSLFLVTLVLSACNKDVPQPNEPTSGVPEKFSELNVNNEFKWETLREVTVQFEGYSAPVIVQRPLKVFLPNASASIYTSSFAINATGLINLEVPADVTELVIQYGAITKQLPISGNMVFSPKPEFE